MAASVTTSVPILLTSRTPTTSGARISETFNSPAVPPVKKRRGRPRKNTLDPASQKKTTVLHEEDNLRENFHTSTMMSNSLITIENEPERNSENIYRTTLPSYVASPPSSPDSSEFHTLPESRHSLTLQSETEMNYVSNSPQFSRRRDFGTSSSETDNRSITSTVRPNNIRYERAAYVPIPLIQPPSSSIDLTIDSDPEENIQPNTESISPKPPEIVNRSITSTEPPIRYEQATSVPIPLIQPPSSHIDLTMDSDPEERIRPNIESISPVGENWSPDARNLEQRVEDLNVPQVAETTNRPGRSLPVVRSVENVNIGMDESLFIFNCGHKFCFR